ncbi:MAG: ExbD/TolR family protein [Limisphaerales bacterium]
MRRFSQRNSLVTLSDINITPLLDLAFVLLIIFMITAPLIDQSIDLRLPEGGRAPRTVKPENVGVLEIPRDGGYIYRGQRATLPDLEDAVITEARDNPNFVLRVRGHRETLYMHVSPVLDLCARNSVNISLATEAPQKR